MQCEGCEFTLIEFFNSFSTFEELINFCASHGLILKNKNCGNEAYNLKRFRCNKYVSVRKQKKRPCGWSEIIFKGTFFAPANLNVKQILNFGNCYLRECFSYKLVASEPKLSEPTINDWASFCRQVLIEWSIINSQPIGGEGCIVEIDESKFGKHKYNVGRIVEGQWVFGGICRQTRQSFMVPVEDRIKNTLLAIVKEKILPGTTIFSDYWRAYDCLSDEGFQHLTVNHSLNFVDPKTKTHTNTIERLWKTTKKKMCRFGVVEISILLDIWAGARFFLDTQSSHLDYIIFSWQQLLFMIRRLPTIEM